jgi:hypothetical protein
MVGTSEEDKIIISKSTWRWIFIVGVVVMITTMIIMNNYILNYAKIVDPTKNPLQTALSIRFNGDLMCFCTGVLKNGTLFSYKANKTHLEFDDWLGEYNDKVNEELSNFTQNLITNINITIIKNFSMPLI